METDETSYLSVEEAITLHILLMREWEESRFGVDRRDLLESALNRPKQASNFGNANILHQAATLCYGLIKNHPWLGGNNHRNVLDGNLSGDQRHILITADNEVVEMALSVEADKWKVPEIQDWLIKKVNDVS